MLNRQIKSKKCIFVSFPQTTRGSIVQLLVVVEIESQQKQGRKPIYFGSDRQPKNNAYQIFPVCGSMITDSVPLPIEFLQPECHGTIVEMCGQPCQMQRLAELGIRQGCKVRMVCRGEPCLICIEGRRISLRLNDSAEIFVIPTAG